MVVASPILLVLDNYIALHASHELESEWSYCKHQVFRFNHIWSYGQFYNLPRCNCDQLSSTSVTFMGANNLIKLRPIVNTKTLHKLTIVYKLTIELIQKNGNNY
jgi:hypothetical protein